MKRVFIILSIFLAVFPAFTSVNSCFAQETIVIEPLFEYPVAPEELTSLTDKSNYLVEHFWDSFDFNTKNTVDQNALNDAFRVYIIPLRWADANLAITQVDKLINTLSKNPTLLFQFTKAAEENLYGPRAEVWVDDIYLKFTDALLKNKKISSTRKQKYEKQTLALRNSRPGTKASEFKFYDADGNEKEYFAMSTPTIFIFGDPSDTDWRLARLKMETNTALNQALDKGQINILFISPVEIEDAKIEFSNYPSKWITGIAPSVGEIYDIRAIPSIYLIGKDGTIILKNSSLIDTIEKGLEETTKNYYSD